MANDLEGFLCIVVSSCPVDIWNQVLTNDILTTSNRPLISTANAMPKRIMLLVCPCRSGSTIMLRAFGHAGVPAFFQPIKNALRWELEGEKRPWEILSEFDRETIFVKETFGPYRQEETTFDPLARLLAAGVPADRIVIVVLVRDPAAVWLSWQMHWRAQTSPELFAETWRACLKCIKTARAHGISVQSLLQENFSTEPFLAMTKLFDLLQLKFPQAALEDWVKKPGFSEVGSGVYMPDEPDVFITPGAHDPVIAARGVLPMDSRGTLCATDRLLLTRVGAFKNYEALLQELSLCSPTLPIHSKNFAKNAY